MKGLRQGRQSLVHKEANFQNFVQVKNQSVSLLKKYWF